MEIRAALPLTDASFEIVTLELREPGPHEICVKIAACGVCHTDMMMMTGGSMMVFGHEASGIVETVGPEVEDVVPGDHVVLSYPSCGVCGACQDQRPYDCLHFSALFSGERLSGTQPLTYKGRKVTPFFGQGGFATHAVVHSSSAVKVDKHIDVKLLGPLGCGVQTGAGSVINFLKPQRGASIAVLGTGSVGLSAVRAAYIQGCSPIIAVDVIDARLNLAKEFGATHIINARASNDIKKEIMDISGGITYAFDSTGSVRLMEIAVACMHQGGRGCGVAAAGMPRLNREDLALQKSWSEIIQGCAVPRLFIPQMIDLYQRGFFPFDKMITYFDFEDINEAFRQAKASKAIKPVLVM